MLYFPIDILSEPCAISCGKPIASNTCDGSNEPDVQALPLDAHIPFRSKFKRSPSPSINLNEILLVPGNLWSVSPFIFMYSIFSLNCSS